MTGSFQALLASARGGGVPPTLTPPINLNSNGNNVTVSFRFDTAGTITYVTTGGSGNGPVAWFTPTGGTPGNGYWVRFNVTSGSANINQAPTFQPLSTSKLLSITAPGLGTAGAIGTIQIASDAAGTTIVGTGSFQLSAN